VRESRSPITTEEVGESLLRKIDDPRTIHGIEGHHHQGDIGPRLRRVRKGVLHKPSPVQRNRFCSIKGGICTHAALSIARMAASSKNSRRGLGAGRSFRGSINRPRYHRIARPNRTVLSIRTSPNSNVLRSSSMPQARRLFNSSRQASVKSLSGSASLGSCTCCLNSPNVLLGSA
jgi:hypothetical protein